MDKTVDIFIRVSDKAIIEFILDNLPQDSYPLHPRDTDKWTVKHEEDCCTLSASSLPDR